MTHPEILRRLPKLNMAAVIMVVCYLGILIWDQLGWWTTDEEYHFGFLIPLFAGFVFMERWPAIRSILVSGENADDPLVAELQMPTWMDRSKVLLWTANLVLE
jgi:hypothetical protein